LPVRATRGNAVSKITSIRNKEKSERKLDLEKLHATTHVLNGIQEDICKGSIDRALKEIEDWIKAAMPEKKKRRSKIWFDKACYKSRSETISSLHRVRKERTEEALQAYHSSKKKYKELLRQKRIEYKE
ncbi:hypothetical protein ANN_27743, partial [Periplaneta americana]